MIVDDPLKNSDSMAALQGLETWWQEEASTRRTNKWAQVVIATRFHTRDLHGILMEGDGMYDPDLNPMGWRWVNIPALCEDPSSDPLERGVGESHWPGYSVFTEEMLSAQKRIMGSNKFAALYQGSPKSEEGALFQPRWWVTHEKVKSRVCWIACDTAFSEKQTADESVLSVWGMRDVPVDEKDDKFYLIDMVHGRWNFPNLLENLKALDRIYNPRCLVIEQAASGQSLIQMLKKEAKIHIHPYKPVRSKTQRLQQVLPLFESDRVRICEGVWNDALRKQLFDFPLVLHDDMVDSVVWGLQYASDMLDGTKEDLYAATLKAKSWVGITNRNKDLGILGAKPGQGRALFDSGERAAAWGGLHEDNRDYNTGRSSRPGRTGGFDERW
jgi:predicted phage terminase large subunit-like protein